MSRTAASSAANAPAVAYDRGVRSAAPSSFAIGAMIAGTYAIERELGRGGMGTVLLASHIRLPGKRVAIKVLHAEVSSDEMRARFKREAEIVSLLAHPNIVHIEDYNVTADGTPYLVLEYLVGESLAQRLARGPLAVEAAMSIVRQVGSALVVAHAKGVVHRDLKPHNIFLVPTEVDGRPLEIAKVLDFGISKMIDSDTVKTEDNALLGTPQYMAPEQATGQHGTIDGRTDVFSFGAIVYEMLSGQPAFTGRSVPEIVFKVVYEEPLALSPTVAPAIVEAIRRAMSKQGTDRFASVSSFVEALTGPSEAFAPTMAPGMATIPDRGPRRPSRKVMVAGGLIGASLVGLVTYVLLRGAQATLDTAAMSSVATQLMSSPRVEIGGRRFRIGQNPKHLKIVKFELDGHAYEAIEQNPEKTSRWAELARAGKRVVQFKDLGANRYIAVLVDGVRQSYDEPSEP